MDKDRALWTITTVLALLALTVSSVYAWQLLTLEKTCQTCIEKKRCYVTLDFSNVTYLGNNTNDDFGPLATGYVFSNET